MDEQHSTWASVDLDRITRNVQRLKKKLRSSTALLSVVKANAYGHGDVQVATAAIAGGSDWLGVVRVEEGMALRKAGVGVPILLLSEPPPAAIPVAVTNDLTLSIHSPATLDAVDQAARMAGKSVSVQIKIDTGMHRYGVDPGGVGRLVALIDSRECTVLQGLWSHLAVAEEVKNSFNQLQSKRFAEVLDSLGGRADQLICHICNSAGALTMPECHYDMVRAGIVIYGIPPAPDLNHLLDLEPAMRWCSRVSMTKWLHAGEAISYGHTYAMPGAGYVSTVPCGYADGLSRMLSNRGEVLIGGKRFGICGNITMDNFLVDTGAERFEVGEEVVMLGSQGGDRITAHEVAERLNTIPYEVVCAIHSRVTRLYSHSRPSPE